MVPVQESGGGLLLKIKNVKGDRIVHALEFFQQYGTVTNEEIPLDVKWNPEYCALAFAIP